MMEDDDDLHGNPATKAHIRRLREERNRPERTVVTHELKTHPNPFAATWYGKKLYEIRENDRDFQVGDWVKLLEFVPCPRCDGCGRVWDNGDRTDCGCDEPHGTYTGRFIIGEVTYMTKGGEWGLPEELCVMSFDARRFFSGGRSKLSSISRD